MPWLNVTPSWRAFPGRCAAAFPAWWTCWSAFPRASSTSPLPGICCSPSARSSCLSPNHLAPLDLAHWGLAFTSVWRRWDALYFLRVAQDGYAHHRGLTAFFPLYPALVRVAAWPLGGHFTLAGLVVSWLCSWGTCLWFYRLVTREYGDRLARQALLFLLCCPLVFFCFAPYSESLFLLVSIGAVERARAGRPWQAGFLGALAMLTRSAGILLLIPLGWEVLRRSERFRRLQARLLLRSPRWLVGKDAFARKMAEEQTSKTVPRYVALGAALSGADSPGVAGLYAVFESGDWRRAGVSGRGRPVESQPDAALGNRRAAGHVVAVYLAASDRACLHHHVG